MTTTELPMHPRTGLRAIGVLPSGRPVWPAMGGDGTGDGNTSGQGGTGGGGQAGGDGGQSSQQQGQGGQQQGGQTPPAQQQPQQGQTSDGGQQQGGQAGGDGDDLSQVSQADLAKMVRDLRKENASSRTNAKQSAADEAKQELAQQIGKAIGLVNDDSGKAPDPEKLAEQLSSERRERYAEKAARKHNLNADRLLDSREFDRKLGKLDPSSESFSSDLESLVKEYAEDDRFKTSGAQAAPPARSGGDFSGGSGGQQNAPQSVDEFRKARRKWRGGDGTE